MISHDLVEYLRKWKRILIVLPSTTYSSVNEHTLEQRNHSSADPIHSPKHPSFSPFLALAIHALRARRRALKLAKPESESCELDATAALANGCRRPQADINIHTRLHPQSIIVIGSTYHALLSLLLSLLSSVKHFDSGMHRKPPDMLRGISRHYYLVISERSIRSSSTAKTSTYVHHLRCYQASIPILRRDNQTLSPARRGRTQRQSTSAEPDSLSSLVDAWRSSGSIVVSQQRWYSVVIVPTSPVAEQYRLL